MITDEGEIACFICLLVEASQGDGFASKHMVVMNRDFSFINLQFQLQKPLGSVVVFSSNLRVVCTVETSKITRQLFWRRVTSFCDIIYIFCIFGNNIGIV